MLINQMSVDAHANSKAHGWWEEDRDILSSLMLIVTEVSEAAEDYRDGKMKTYHTITRNSSIVRGTVQWMENPKTGGKDLVYDYGDGSPDVRVLDLGNPTDMEFLQSCGYELKPEGFPTELADVVIRVGDLAGRLGIDLAAVIGEKMAYNITRPYRHGGKRA